MDKKRYAELKEKYKDEKVFIVPYDKVSAIEDKFNKCTHDNSIWSKYDQIGRYVYRYDAEENYAFVQLIPYIVIFNEHNDKVFVAKRIDGESRLINQISLGFGGHINEEDGFVEPLFKCAFRELFEEVTGSYTGKFTHIGTVRDAGSELRDHLGIVFTVNALEESVSINEKDTLIGEWMTMDQLKENYGKFESWARHIIDYFYENNILGN